MLTKRCIYPQSAESACIRISVRKLTLVSISTLVSSFVFCVVWSVIFNFQASTHTHCEVFNFLPSFSSAIGRNKLQGYVWKSAVALHALPHILLTRLYYGYNREILLPCVHHLVHLLAALSVTENISLVGLSFITNEMHYAFHQNFFLFFMMSSEFHMMLTCLLVKTKRRNPPNEDEVRSYLVKFRMLMINMGSFALAGYFFIRHAQYCEPLVFSLFSFFEYVVVFANMGFHLTACWDFSGVDLNVALSGITFIAAESGKKWPCKALSGS